MTITFKGDREIEAFLAQLPLNVQRNAGRRALRAGGRVLADAARANLTANLKRPSTGLTAKDIVVRTSMQDGFVTAKVKLTKGKRGRHYIGWFLEFGVDPHYISSGDSVLSPRSLTKKHEREGVLRLGDNLVTGPVEHPGFPAKPFMRPALDTHAGEAIKAIGAELRAQLQKSGFRSGGDGGDDE